MALIYAAEIALLSVAMLKRPSPAAAVLLSKPAVALHILAVLGLACLAYGRFIEPRWLDINTIRVPTGKLHNTTFRIVHISDLHCSDKPLNEHRMVPIINSLQPDIIVFTGDALNDAGALPRLKNTLKSLNAKLAKLAVRGNFEVHYWRDLDLFGQTGFKVLDRDCVSVEKNGEKIAVAGLSCEYDSGFEQLLHHADADCFSVFLYHYPHLVEQMQDAGPDLYLCGHTHGGQVALPFYGALITLSQTGKKYEAGLYKLGRTRVYVNRGIGLENRPAPQVRFLARPEIAVFEIVPAQAGDG